MKIEIVQVERGGYNLPKISKVGIGAKHYGCAIQRKSLDKSWWHSTWMGFQTVRRFSMIFTTPIISFLHGQDMPRFSTRKKLNMLQQDSMCLAFLFFLYVSLCFFIAMCFRHFIHLPPAASALGWAWPPKFRHAAAGRICSSRRAQLHPWRRVAVRRRFENGGSLGSSEMAGHGVHLRLGRLGHGLMCRIHDGTWIGQIQSAPTP